MWPLARCISRDTLRTLRLFSLVFFNSHGGRSTLYPGSTLLYTPLSPRDKASCSVGLPLITGPSQAYRSDLLTWKTKTWTTSMTGSTNSTDSYTSSTTPPWPHDQPHCSASLRYKSSCINQKTHPHAQLNSSSPTT